jgi:ATP-dependent DNA helicase RecG
LPQIPGKGSFGDAAAVPGLSLADLSTEAMLRFAKRARRKGRVPDDAESEGPRGLVHRLRLERDGYLTNAAALLFCPEPDVYVPGCSVKIGFFEGPEIIYQDEVGGPIVEQVDEVVELLYSKYLRAKISYDGIQRVERYPFPRAAVREVLVNAVAHKNYASGAPVQVRVYDDQLVVCNACVLPDGWGIEDLLGFHASEPHNPKIANAFFLAGLVESWGRGVQKVFTECKLDGILPPEYSLAGGSLLVRLTAPSERIVQTGSRMARKPGDSGENLAIGGAKPGDSGENLAIEITPDTDRKSLSATTASYVVRLREQLAHRESFGRADIVAVLGGS